VDVEFFSMRQCRGAKDSIRSLGLANNNGVDIDSCEAIRIEDCNVVSGDDAI
jgi:polygalacturonase